MQTIFFPITIPPPPENKLDQFGPLLQILCEFRVLSIFAWGGGKSILKKIFEPRGGEKNFF